jgi:uncharacterized linocin/CFP29 family protein
VRLRIPFTVNREDVDDVERGAKDPDWQPVKDAAKKIAFAEDRAVFEGYAAAGIAGVKDSTSNPVLTLPAEAREYPNAVSQALSALRLAGVGGPFSLLLSADIYTMVSETTDHGYPIREHLARVVDEIIWAPAIEGAYLLSGRGGDFELQIGQDLSIGYASHNEHSVQLYLQETFTYRTLTAEAAVVLSPAGAAASAAGAT